MKQGFDCHAHVYAQVEENEGSNYRPSRPAPLDEWQQHLMTCELRGGVLVQPSFLGHDNRELLRILGQLGEDYRGVVQLPADTSLTEMRQLGAAGIVGVRWNLIERRRELPDLSDPRWIDFLDRLKILDWHLELHLEGDRLPELFPALHEHGVSLVIDHLGLPVEADPRADAGFRLLLEAGRYGRTWVKLSAPYRSPVRDLQPHVCELLNELGRERLVWGSDWPWTRHEGKHGYRDTLDWLTDWVRDEDDRRVILNDSPRRLFHLD
ncbi:MULTISPECIES: amidohydrolase family protein [Halomonadaceae]|uniref:Amidohydrolase family protein n=1 Tax=Billgrantia aerodenitrificans TaxID=2733483 RepID=A0ABS9AVC2_9GAMM|nr:amidohydrolase family protein [Halomonas sp. KM-1]MCE8025679.1 amidohydrolase family protein [Halomonas aerodenitrificans]MCE8038470.1 amidohydrolase family protein [Halomonas sp. MCCC 1A11062]